MDEQRRRPDPGSRPDPYELAVQRAAEEPGSEEVDGTPPLPRLHVGPLRVGPTGLLVGIALLVGAGTLVRFGGGDRTPELAPSCTAPALELSVQRVRPGGLVQYAVAGPDGQVEVRVLRAAGGEPVQVLPPVTVQGCAATGRFGVQAEPGEHVVQVLVDGVAVASDDLVVTDPRDPVVG